MLQLTTILASASDLLAAFILRGNTIEPDGNSKD
jgi:hypothetical protein